MSHETNDRSIKSQVLLIANELEAGAKGDAQAATLSICNLLAAAHVLANRFGIQEDCLMQTYQELWMPVVETLVTL